MGLEKQFEVCFLVKRFDFKTTSKQSKPAPKPYVTADCDYEPNSRCSDHSSSRMIKTENKEEDNKMDETVSYQVYKLPSLSRNYTPREKKKGQNTTAPQVCVQGQKCFEEDEDNMAIGKQQCGSPKSLSEISRSHSSLVSSDENFSPVDSEEDAKETKNFSIDSGTISQDAFMDYNCNSKHNIPSLEGRKVNLEMKQSDERTLRRIERLKTLRTEENRATKELYFMNATEVNYQKLVFKQRTGKGELNKVRKFLNSGNDCGEHSTFSYDFSTQERHKSRRRCSERKSIELPKVESYDILTPRKIITSDVCHVFKESTVAKVTVSDSREDTPRNDKNKHWKKAFLKEVFGQTNVVEMRNPSPVHGMRLNPKKEQEAIDKALKLVEESNSAEEKKLEIEAEKEIKISVPVQKFVIHLPSIC